jgi:hypothetical protein
MGWDGVIYSIISAVIVLGLLLIVVRIQQAKRSVADRAPGARWQRTEEVIRDPFTSQVVRVWIDPTDGSRHYVPERSRKRGPEAG